ncbi:hypothetical protein MOUN0_I01046 [Monosporozyma unispora]
MDQRLKNENELLLANNQMLTSQLGEMTEKLHDSAQKLQALNFSLAEQKVTFINEASKNKQTIEILNQKIEQLQAKRSIQQADIEPTSVDVKTEDPNEESNYKEINEQLKDQVVKLIEELESKLPMLEDLETTNKELKEKVVSTIFQLETVADQNEKIKSENRNLSEKFKQATVSINTLKTKCKDLSSQVQHLLSKDQNIHTSLIPHDRKISNSQQVISSALVNFNNIEELQAQNIKLITSIRELTTKFEENAQGKSRFPEKKSTYSPAMQILQAENDDLKARLQVLKTENDSYKALIVGNTLIKQQEDDAAMITNLNEQMAYNEITNRKTVAELDGNLNQKDTEINQLNDKLSYIAKEKEDLVTEVKVLQNMNDKLREDIKKEQKQNNEWELHCIEQEQIADGYGREFRETEEQMRKVVNELDRWRLDHHEVIKMLDEEKDKKRKLERELFRVKEQLAKATPENNENVIARIKDESLQQSRFYNTKVQELVDSLTQKEQTFEHSLSKANSEIKWLQEQLNNKETPVDDDDLMIISEHSVGESETKPVTYVSNTSTQDSSQINEIDPSTTIETLKYEKNVFQNKAATLEVEVNLLKEQLNLLERRYNININSIAPPINELFDDTEVNEKYSKIVNEISDLNILKEKITTISTDLQKTVKEKSLLNVEIQNLHNVNKQQCLELHTCKDRLQFTESALESCKEELIKWRTTADELSAKNPEELKSLSEEVERLKNTLQIETTEKNDLEDRFNRLKKQAHEKLDASKATSAQLTEEVNNLSNKQAELELVISRYKEMEREYGIKKEEFSKMQENLNLKDQELKSLQTKFEASSSKSEVEEKIKMLKEEYEQKEKELIDKISSEMKTKYESSENTSPADIDKMREEWENETLARIEEAKENLKKHIRLPSEEKIKKVIDKRRDELESEFNRRVEEKANALKLSEELNKPADDIAKDLEQKIKDRLEEEFNNTLKKKAFEEGKYQASMRTTLLERKITKLEAQLEGIASPDNNTSTTEQPKSSSGLSKINIDNPFNVSQSNLKPENKTFSTLSNIESPFSSQDKTKNPFSSTNSPAKDGNVSSSSITVKKPFMFGSAAKPTFTSLSALPQPLTNNSSGSPFIFRPKSEEINPETDCKRKLDDSISKDTQAKKLKSDE